ncbi:MAG: hypothetical protein NTX52_08775 [Planctomycetota bacterium]|nr:hypothetical protein [Planctomycetota bacterium]
MKPVLQALILAEHVYEDRSGKKIIAGTFDRVMFSRKSLGRVEQPDGTHKTIIPGGMHGGSPFAYLRFTDVCDDTTLSLQFVNLTKNQVLFRNEATLTDVARLAVVELVFPLPPLPIAEAGVYAFEVVCEGEIVGSYRITAEELKLQ